ncbi:hypothetical protein F4553_001306 [Allocatelliglobosispora scoriae]|uniref:Pvc16 N-terminal domain-containing protein n=1 Tax=Allocatelliglobosispora scoriae TaxID=643052 RepID=A0A841BFR3_9ACTN|nr:DUF4255 domain-containing protein [Allocatelliglobosispora scoriae]MBB5867927.1 hypothetical protein [Allocatelliglobosispora scoriae]
MIFEVDDALTALLRREAIVDDAIEIVLDAPTKDWSSRRNAPTLNVYLYDIREDLRRRTQGRVDEYDKSGRVVARRVPPRYFVLSYLLTAWTARPEDEHRLLSAALSCLLAHDAIPVDLLTGGLAEAALPVPITVALPPPEDRSFADVWSALGGELHPSLDVRIVAPIQPGIRFTAGPPVQEVIVRINP